MIDSALISIVAFIVIGVIVCVSVIARVVLKIMFNMEEQRNLRNDKRLETEYMKAQNKAVELAILRGDDVNNDAGFDVRRNDDGGFDLGSLLSLATPENIARFKSLLGGDASALSGIFQQSANNEDSAIGNTPTLKE